MSLAKIFAQSRTVRDRRRAVVLMSSTGKSRSARDQSAGLRGEPANVFKYPKTPWWRSPCQLKYRNVTIAHAKGTVALPVGDERNGNTPKRFASKMNTEIEPTTGICFSNPLGTFSRRMSRTPKPKWQVERAEK